MRPSTVRLTYWGAAVALLAGIGTYLSSGSEPASASPPALQACTANDVSVNVVQLGTVNGQRLEAFELTNIGSSTCGMEGYPSLKFFTSSRLDARVNVRDHSSAFAPVTPKLLAIGPQEVVSFGLSYKRPNALPTSDSKQCNIESILIQFPARHRLYGRLCHSSKFERLRARRCHRRHAR